MKKLLNITKLMLWGTLSLSLMGCPNSGSAPIDPEPDLDPLTPKEQKTRIKEIGLKFVDAIEAKTHENLVEVLAYMDDEGYAEYDIDEEYIEILEDLYTETVIGDYAPARKANPIKAMQGLMALSLDAAQTGAQLATRADDIYMYTLEAGLKDLYGGFKPDTRNEVWVYDSSISDRVEVSFTDDQDQEWVATLKGSKETTTVQLTGEYIYYDGYVSSWGSSVYDEHEKYDITIEVPKVITLSVACSGKTVVDMTVNSSLPFEIDLYENDYYSYYYGSVESNYEYDYSIDYKNLNLDAKLNVNGYAESWVVKASKTNINTTAEVKIDGKSMLKANATLNADIENIIEQLNDAANEDSDDEIELDFKALKSFTMNIDVMGELQIQGKCSEFEELYDAFMGIGDAYEDGDFKKFDRKVDQLNDFYDVTLHYDNANTIQARVELEAYEYEYEDYYDEYTDYAVRPVLVFAVDDSRYCFEDYFTERSFEDLIDAVDELAEDFEDMFDRYF